MDIVAQIITETVGEPKRKEFRVKDLDKALSSSGERKHVTLYPADYKSEWQGEGFIEIPSDVTVTIMPGAVVEYDADFQLESFQVPDGEGGTETYNGPPIAPTSPSENSNHPLNYREGDAVDTYAKRYAAPNFGGAVENISDLNLGSEWVLRQEFERSVIWRVKGEEAGEEFLSGSEGRDAVSFSIPFRGVMDVEGGNKVYVETEELSGEDEGAKLTVNHTKLNDFDERSDQNNPYKNNNTAEVIQTLSVNDGHVTDAITQKVVTRIGANDDAKLDFTGNQGALLVSHGETGPADADGNPTTLPSPPSGSSSIKTFESDNRGHIKNIEYGPNVEKVQAGRAISISGPETASPEVGVDASGFSGGKNISINDANPIDFTLNDATYRNALSSDPSDPSAGEAVLWLSDGTATGSDGDVLLKVTDGSGTTKTATLFDFSSA